ncbi:hypothetical protein [Streptomyces sp. NPDC088727]|uniref:hypothetical protein n=1 Tax=Streptomyces sp. NPDC088727 TaxID=3365875 RepID=UPI00380C922B
MEIKIQVSDITLDTVVAQAMVWDQDNEEMYPTGSDKTVADLVAQQITERLVRDDRYPGLRDQVTELRKTMIREKVGPMLDEALNGEVRQTNNYGEPVGRAITFRELVVGEVKKVINEAPNNYNNRDKGTALQIAVRAEVKTAVATAVTEEVTKMNDLIRQQVAEGISENAIAALIANQLKPQS